MSVYIFFSLLSVMLPLCPPKIQHGLKTFKREILDALFGVEYSILGKK